MIRIGIVGTGGIASAHATAFQAIRGCKLVAACDIVRSKAEAFGETYGIAQVYDDVGEMLSDVDLDAVSNVTSDAAHCPVSLRVIAAGKHVLCEKPLAVNYAEAKKMAQAARRKGVINMVNFSYRNSSAIHRARDLVAAGEIGHVMHVEASYLQSWLSSKAWGDWRTGGNWLWRLSSAHGSTGALGDLGVHIIDFVTCAVGDVKAVNCLLKTFHKVKGKRVGAYELDANDSAVITVELKNGGIGTIHASRWATGHTNSLLLRIFGDKGAIVVDLDSSYTELRICRGKDVDEVRWRTVKCGKTPTIYQRFVKSIRTDHNDQPDFARGAVVQKVLDACFESAQTGRTVRI